MNKKKITLPWRRFQKPLLLILAGVLLMAAGKFFPVEEEQELAIETELVTETAATTLEAQIEQLLCAISGVKHASVVITYENSGEQLVEKDVTSQSDKTHEADGQGGNRVVESGQQQEETVYVEDAQGNKYPFVKTETYGTIRGVAVVVSGTYDSSIREKIVRTLEVLLDVPTHKVQVIW